VKIVILGGGFGGITAALELSRGVAREHTITLVERAPVFMMGLRMLWMVTGGATRRRRSCCSSPSAPRDSRSSC